MEMTHAQARRLIQFSLDRALEPDEKIKLQSHLSDCLECNAFANELKEVEKVLVPVMQKHWAYAPVPLSLSRLTDAKKMSSYSSIILTIRTALISLMLVVFVLTAWQFTRSTPETFRPLPAGVQPVPTPSGQSTSTQVNFLDCRQVVYLVKPNDTLASIAERFLTTKEKIKTINQLRSDEVVPDRQLFVPICASTPTITHSPSTLTTTFTPLFNQITSTPGG